jgi:hypothetical protein
MQFEFLNKSNILVYLSEIYGIHVILFKGYPIDNIRVYFAKNHSKKNWKQHISTKLGPKPAQNGSLGLPK